MSMKFFARLAVVGIAVFFGTTYAISSPAPAASNCCCVECLPDCSCCVDGVCQLCGNACSGCSVNR